MSYTGRILQLVGTFLPVYGIALTITAAYVLRRGWRAAALVAIPLITLWLCSVFGDRIAYDGNMLYVLLALLYFVALCLYYPVLLILGIIWLIRKRQKKAQQNT